MVFFDLEDGDGIVDHCGIYLGDGEFIHSASSWNGICVMPLSGIYEDGFLCAVRYLPETIEEAGQRLRAKVPGIAQRSTCTLSTLWELNRALSGWKGTPDGTRADSGDGQVWKHATHTV